MKCPTTASSVGLQLLSQGLWSGYTPWYGPVSGIRMWPSIWHQDVTQYLASGCDPVSGIRMWPSIWHQATPHDEALYLALLTSHCYTVPLLSKQEWDSTALSPKNHDDEIQKFGTRFGLISCTNLDFQIRKCFSWMALVWYQDALLPTELIHKLWQGTSQPVCLTALESITLLQPQASGMWKQQIVMTCVLMPPHLLLSHNTSITVHISEGFNLPTTQDQSFILVQPTILCSHTSDVQATVQPANVMGKQAQSLAQVCLREMEGLGQTWLGGGHFGISGP